MLVALAAVIPFSTALTNIAFGLLLLCWLVSGDFAGKLRMLRSSNAAMASVAIFLLIGAATLYSLASPQVAVHYWLGCRKWLLIPLAATLVCDQLWQRRVLWAFACAATLDLACSLAIAAYPLPFLGDAFLAQRASLAEQGIYGLVGVDPTAQSLEFLIAGAFCLHLSAVPAPAGPGSGARAALRALALAFVLDIIYLSGGRTGFLLCLVVLPLCAWQLLPRRKALIALVLLGCAIPLFWVSSPHLRTRSLAVVHDVQRYDAAGHADQANSTGLRLSFYRNALELIGENPLLGTGTGSIETAYSRLLAAKPGTAEVPTSNLHNEYLNMAAQFGLLGLLAFLAWIASHWAAARLAQPPWRPLAQTTILVFAIGSLANSLFTTSREGYLYALLIGALLAPATLARGGAQAGAGSA